MQAPIVAKKTYHDGPIGVVPVFKPKGSSLIQAFHASLEDKQF